MSEQDSISIVSKNQRVSPRRKTTAQFIIEAKNAHGETYCYEKSIYVTAAHKITITCRKHGDFKQYPLTHTAGKGCPACGLERRAAKRIKGIEWFLGEARRVHGEKYLYEKTKYINIKGKVIITCKIHGDFSQTPDSHLNKRYGCPDCGIESRANTQRFDLKKFIKKSSDIHDNKYDYSKVSYIDIRTKVEIVCQLHGSFMQSPYHHLRGYGCQECGRLTSYRRSEYVEICEKIDGMSNLYIIKCTGSDEEFYKVGITRFKLSRRFDKHQMPYRYKKVLIVHGEAGLIWDLEKKIHRMLRRFRYEPKLSFGGETECFTKIPDEILTMLNNSAQTELVA